MDWMLFFTAIAALGTVAQSAECVHRWFNRSKNISTQNMSVPTSKSSRKAKYAWPRWINRASIIFLIYFLIHEINIE